MIRRAAGLLLALTLIALNAPLSPLSAASPGADTKEPDAGVKHMGPDLYGGRRIPIARWSASTARASAGKTVGTAEVGDVRKWIALDDEQGALYIKKYKLRGRGKHSEVWVATGKDPVCDGDPETPCPVAEDTIVSGTKFPPGDCRNDGRTRITDGRVKYIVKQFDTVIFPRESKFLSQITSKDGSDALLPRLVDLPRNYYTGAGKKVVVLVDNVRDDNFYDTDNQSNLPYIAGFFSSQFDDQLLDRNVMTIDANDWKHRTGANPPDDGAPGDLCASQPARPFLYESTFAHEYQHLLEHNRDVDEVSWVDEGMADWAQVLTGYASPEAPITDSHHDSHIQCFLGNLGIQTPANPTPRDGGPENGLTPWGDQGDEEILCDYGAAFSLMLKLESQYGRSALTKLHNNRAPGFTGLGNVLASFSSGATSRDFVHDWLAAVALDGVLQDGATLAGGTASDYLVDELVGLINWDTAEAYSTPGAPPNGADYVRVRDGANAYLNAGQVNEIVFDGSSALPPDPVEWTSDPDPPAHPGNPALHSGSGPNFDRSLVMSVKVPNGNAPDDPPTLTFDTLFETEELFDYAMVQVSTDGGQSYTSLSNASTTSEHDTTVPSLIVDNLPGLNGNSGCPPGSQVTGECVAGWVNQSFDLTPYAGQTILLNFRYMTDGGVDLAGWWLDNVKVGKTELTDGTNPGDWETMTQIDPQAVEGFTVQVIGYTDDHTQAFITQLPLNAAFDGSLSGDALRQAIGSTAQTVGVLVTFDDSTEQIVKYAPYTLTVNGVTQPGGQ